MEGHNRPYQYDTALEKYHFLKFPPEHMRLPDSLFRYYGSLEYVQFWRATC